MPDQAIKSSLNQQESAIEYRDISGFPGYRIGSDGSVWTCRRRSAKNRHGTRGHGALCGALWLLDGKWKKMRPNPNKNGYFTIGIYLPSGKRITCRVAHIVLAAFVSDRPEGMECRHGPRGRSDNSLGNLCWGTKAENMADKVRDGTHGKGERNPRAKLTETQVDEIRTRFSAGLSKNSLANRFGVTRQLINQIVKGKIWKHLLKAC